VPPTATTETAEIAARVRRSLLVRSFFQTSISTFLSLGSISPSERRGGGGASLR
jgi:hypothetical protein